jgi:hypothetical protein
VPRPAKAELAIAHLSVDRRLECPPELSGVEAEIFRQTVASMPLRHFAAEDLPLLCAHSRAVALERRAAEELAVGATCAGGTLPSPWLAVRDRSAQTLLRYAVRLRLGPRAREPVHQRSGTSNPKSNRPPSYYEIMEREREKR